MPRLEEPVSAVLAVEIEEPATSIAYAGSEPLVLKLLMEPVEMVEPEERKRSPPRAPCPVKAAVLRRVISPVVREPVVAMPTDDA